MLCISLRLFCSLVCTSLKAFTHIDTRIRKGWNFLKKLFKIEKRDNRKDTHIHPFKPELTFRTFFFENKL